MDRGIFRDIGKPDKLPERQKAPPGVLFVFKTSFFAKKIQKYELLLYKRALFSLSKQNKEILYKNSCFWNFFVQNSLFWDYLHQILKKTFFLKMNHQRRGIHK